MAILSFIGGAYFLKLLSQEALKNIFSVICEHFASPFHGDALFSQKLFRYLALCWSDILSALLIFIFSFSYISCFVSDLIILYQGFTLGFCSALLCAVGTEYVGFVHVSSYIASKIIIVLLLVLFACKMSFYSIDK